METLTLEQASYLAEIVGVFAVVISLIYVGREVRQNTQATQVSAAQSFVDAYNTFTSELSRSDEMADILIRGTGDFQSLTNQERVRFSALQGQLFRLLNSAYIQWQKGAIDDDFWSGINICLADSMTQPGIKKWWEYRKRWYGKEFQNLVETNANSDASITPIPYIQETI